MYKLFVIIFTTIAVINGENRNKSEDEQIKQSAAFFRKDYLYYEPENAFYKLHRVRGNFKDAVLRCRFEGSKLFMPKTKAIAKTLLDEVNKKYNYEVYQGSFLVGLHATISRGDYFTLDGEPLRDLPEWRNDVEFTNETNTRNEPFSCVNLNHDGNLVNSDCDDTYPFICFHKRDTSVFYTKCGPSNNGYEYYKDVDHCYKFHRIPRTYSRAFMTCAAEGAKLANIYSDVEQAVLEKLYLKNPANTMDGVFCKKCAFVGLFDWGEHGDWVTTDGAPMSTTAWKWHPGDPDNSTSADFCTGVNDHGELNDLRCDQPGPFICKMKPNALKSI